MLVLSLQLLFSKHRVKKNSIFLFFTITKARMMRKHHAITSFVFLYIIRPITLADEHTIMSAVMVKSNINHKILTIKRRFFLSHFSEHLNRR